MTNPPHDPARAARHAAVIEKIRLLRALATSSNVHEASAAAAKAERLAQEHRIAEAELAIESDDGGAIEEAFTKYGSALPFWKVELLSAIAEAHGCAVFFEKDGKRERALIAGRAEDIAMMRHLYGWLTGEVDRLLGATRMKKRDRRMSFRFGAAQAIAMSLTQAARASRGGASKDALARLDRRLLEAQQFRQRIGATDAVDADKVFESRAYLSGFVAGQSVNVAAKEQPMKALGMGSKRP